MIIGATGHQNIPRKYINYFRDQIEGVLKNYENFTGLSSLAAGSDQLFAELVIKRGGELSVVIPCKGYETTFKAAEKDAYSKLLSKAKHIKQLDFPWPSEEAYMQAGMTIVNTASLIIAVWDGRSARGLGGTADVVKYARSLGKNVVVVWPDGVER